MIQLLNDAVLVKKLAIDGNVYKKDGKIEILKKNKNGEMVAASDGLPRKGFTPYNKEMIE